MTCKMRNKFNRHSCREARRFLQRRKVGKMPKSFGNPDLELLDTDCSNADDL